MNKARTKLGNKLFKLAKDVYPEGKNGSQAKKKFGDFLFKLAATVSPDKPQKIVTKAKGATVKAKKAVASKKSKTTKK